MKFDIDANGILNVKATDKATGKEQAITITASSGLSKDEVEKMKKEAELHADEDKKKQEAIETKNLADTMIYTTEKMLRDAGDKVKPEDKKPIEEKIEELKKVKEGTDIEAIKKVADELSQAAQKVGAAMYEAQKNVPAGAAGGASSGSDAGAKEGPIEGEVVNDKKE
ncbi:MAG: Chaperone protein DnaK [Candidatus Magasanikbacteria bacterium GW2011_GWA2_42_32]|uniref:Chaperone protein DnaK n=1 Tax=Candidatus Magasanikbacteria bacterium GW2011_GWA2_42_32 TaxID=1619039 RepID=A0A0G1CVI8_9BACT|nr:MAG: Chaperone protein DnaK [Candidatus Magasanikbacteria bacterium GW2011_GWA2_42_32]